MASTAQIILRETAGPASPADDMCRTGLARTRRFRLFSPRFQGQKENPVPDKLADIRYDIAIANRMLANEGVLDAFGHVSLRHPGDPERYLLPRSRSPQLIEPSDVLEFTLDSEPVKPASQEMESTTVEPILCSTCRRSAGGRWTQPSRSAVSPCGMVVGCAGVTRTSSDM